MAVLPAVEGVVPSHIPFIALQVSLFRSYCFPDSNFGVDVGDADSFCVGCKVVCGLTCGVVCGFSLFNLAFSVFNLVLSLFTLAFSLFNLVFSLFNLVFSATNSLIFNSSDLSLSFNFFSFSGLKAETEVKDTLRRITARIVNNRILLNNSKDFTLT